MQDPHSTDLTWETCTTCWTDHHADYTAPTRQHEVDHTDHTNHTDQRSIYAERPTRPSSGNRLSVQGVQPISSNRLAPVRIFLFPVIPQFFSGVCRRQNSKQTCPTRNFHRPSLASATAHHNPQVAASRSPALTTRDRALPLARGYGTPTPLFPSELLIQYIRTAVFHGLRHPPSINLI